MADKAQDRALHGLIIEQQRLEEHGGDDPAWLVREYVARAVRAGRRLDRLYWLRATADVVLDAADEPRPLLRLAARHISATHALSARDRNAAIRFAKAVPVA